MLLHMAGAGASADKARCCTPLHLAHTSPQPGRQAVCYKPGMHAGVLREAEVLQQACSSGSAPCECPGLG